MRRMRNVTSSSSWTHSSHWAATSYVSPFINPDETMDTLSNPDRWRSYLEAVGLDAFMLARYTDVNIVMIMIMLVMMMTMMISMVISMVMMMTMMILMVMMRMHS
jgi:hypothetical protein